MFSIILLITGEFLVENFQMRTQNLLFVQKIKKNQALENLQNCGLKFVLDSENFIFCISRFDIHKVFLLINSLKFTINFFVFTKIFKSEISIRNQQKQNICTRISFSTLS